MCGRFALFDSEYALEQQFEATIGFPMAPRYNIAPSQPVLVLRRGLAGVREFTHLDWGLVPYWTKDPLHANRPINARAESIAEKPSFRGPFRHHRCLIPSSGFFEWKKQGNGKRPYFVRPKGGGLFGLAAIWDGWMGADGSEIESFAILTTGANALMAPIHDRMPVIIPSADYALWLDTTAAVSAELVALMAPFPAEAMESYPVSTLVNSPAAEGEECVRRQDPVVGSLF
ncbi:MAG TPA: SOS response-associated peptidase [Candidatus Deferrimicrobiaceae bacterium]|jgi:putative SOS response-associated peptidase YedK